MTTHELAHKLLAMDDMMVTISGYEGGVEEIKVINKPEHIHLGVNTEWFYGEHEYHSNGHCRICSNLPSRGGDRTMAVHLS